MEKNNEIQQPAGQKYTQKARVLDYIKKHGSIDRKAAYEELGIFELPARICDLQREGYEFEKKTKTGRSRWGYSFYNTEYRLKNYIETREEK